MQWEILVAVIVVIGVCTAIMEARAKRMARKRGNRDVDERSSIKEAYKKRVK